MRSEKLAAVGEDFTASASSTRRTRSQQDLWLLVQSAQSRTPSATPHEELVLAAFPSSASESLDEEVAKTHGLEIAGRNTMSSLGLRLVRYRIPDGRSLSNVVERLKADPRVESAQANVRYALPEQQSPIEMSRPGEPTAAPQRIGKAGSRPASLASARPEPKQNGAPHKMPGRSQAMGKIKRVSSRVGNIGDVLSGGL